MHIPLPINDETLYGVLARSMYINGFWKHLSGMEKLTGHKVTSLANLKVEALLNSDYVSSLSSADYLGVSSVEKHLGVSEHIAHDLISYSSGLSTSGSWKTCSQCIEVDIEQYGTGSWHLTHQLPTTLICPVHGEPLKLHAVKRKMLHERFYLPMDIASVDLEIDISVRPHLENLARLAYDAVRDRSEPYPAEVVRQTFKRAMIEKGLLKTGRLSKNVVKELSDFFGPLDIYKAMGINPARLVGGIFGNDELPVIYRVILVYWWFGSWQLFKLFCFWQSIFINPESATQQSHSQDIRQNYRDRCLMYIETVEGAERYMFLKSDYRAFRWLRSNDRKWLDKQFPIINQIQYSLFKSKLIP